MKLNFEVFTETTYESTKMIEGILYEMRVFAVNAIGVSQPSMNTKPFMPIGNVPPHSDPSTPSTSDPSFACHQSLTLHPGLLTNHSTSDLCRFLLAPDPSFPPYPLFSGCFQHPRVNPCT